MRAIVFAPMALALVVGLAACSSAPPRSDSNGNPAAASNTDEQKLLTESARAVSEIESKGLLLNDPEVVSYISRVGTRVTSGQPDHPPLQFHVLRDSVINAFAFPNGHIYVTVGLLARLENEAQLAFVLGHEAAHVERHHSLESLHDRRTKVVAAHIADLMLFGTSVAYIPFAASMASYSRDQEREADELGLRASVQAGYPAQSIIAIFTVMAEVKNAEAIHGSIYADHPTDVSREQDMRGFIEKDHLDAVPAIDPGTTRYAAVRQRIVHENLELKLRASQYELMHDAAELALQHAPQDPWLYYYRGEARRSMGADPKGAAREHAWIHDKKNLDELEADFTARQSSLYADARRDFEHALALDPGFAYAYRGLGLIAHDQGDSKASQQALQFYLEHAQGVRDARYIRSLLREMQPQ